MVSLLAPMTYVKRSKIQAIKRLDRKTTSIRSKISEKQAELKSTKLARDKLTWETCSMSRDDEMRKKIAECNEKSAAICEVLSSLRAELAYLEKKRSNLLN